MPDGLESILTLVIGFLLPPVLAYADRRQWTSSQRTLLAWGLSAVVAVAWAAYTGKLGLNMPTAQTIGVIVLVSETCYNVFWRKLGGQAASPTISTLITQVTGRLTGRPEIPR